ncbi:MAG: M24 family metallopeptidase [Bacillota bacterium]
MRHRIDKIRTKLQDEGLEAFLVSSRSNCFYASGFTGTAGTILFTPDNNYFLTDSRYTEQAKQEVAGYEIIEVGNQNRRARFRELLESENVNQLGFEAREISYRKYALLNDELSEIELKPVDNLVEDIRIVKEEREIEAIKQAVDIADQAFVHILDFIESGIREKDIALELEYFMKQHGGQKNSFDFIVASGLRSALPHGTASGRKIQKGDFITMDFGTKYEGYCSDMTRTVVVGEPNQKQCEIYDIVLAAHRKVISGIKAGLTCGEADALARDLIKDKNYGQNFGHNLGHGLGIDVHEAPRLAKDSDQKLQKNMIVTNEPGIYIPQWGGVRIEDSLLIKEDGCEVLNNSDKELIRI